MSDKNNITVGKLYRVSKFLSHTYKTLIDIKNGNCSLGRTKVISQYFKICSRYILWEIILGKKISQQNIFSYKWRVLNYRLFITLFETIFIFDEYYFEVNAKSPVIVDGGANIGMSALYFKLLYPNSRIIAAEPDPTTFKVFEENIRINKLLNITPVNKAISGKSERIEFFINPLEPGSLIMSANKDRIGGGKKITVQSTTISQLIKNLKQVDMLKLDIEGQEEEALKELYESGEIPKIGQMIFEYHHHINPKVYVFSKVLNMLEKANFNYQISTYKSYAPFLKDQYQDLLIFAYK